MNNLTDSSHAERRVKHMEADLKAGPVWTNEKSNHFKKCMKYIMLYSASSWITAKRKTKLIHANTTVINIAHICRDHKSSCCHNPDKICPVLRLKCASLSYQTFYFTISDFQVN